MEKGFARQRRIGGYVVLVVCFVFLVDTMVSFAFATSGWGVLFAILTIAFAANAWNLMKPKSSK